MRRFLSTTFALSFIALLAASCSTRKTEPTIEADKPADPQALANGSGAGANGAQSAGVGASTAGSDADASRVSVQRTDPSSSEVVPAAQRQQLDPTGTCGANMILVEGEYCTKPKQECTNWIDDPQKYPYARCAEFASPSTCEGEKIHLKFCIDKYEASESNGSNLPVGDTSWTDAQNACRSQGKRLCQEREWVLACEGEEMKPYPYGYVRNPEVCNFERKDDLTTNSGALADHRQQVTANEQCLSPYGVQNMVGNIDEWVVLDRPHYSAKNGGRKMMSGLKGGWWGPLRNRCRPTTVDHDEYFHELQTGYRCCADSGQLSAGDVPDLARPAAIVFAAVFFGIQGTLIATGSLRPERAFGFQMFPEASTATISLLREVRGADGVVRAVPMPGGVWRARGRDGVERTFRWTDRIKYQYLQRLDQPAFASYGVAAHLHRLQGALDDVATHTPDDAETLRFLARVEVKKNGHPSTFENLSSVPR
ncbi:MAG: SUMF1/EgtB/PvdO family nonheme iron enzyme [Polyangiaceae bacterium]